nr:carbohydrate kinase [Clostridium nigeriense]
MLKKVLCIGELLIDLVSTDGETYIRKPGGAPANVAVAISKLGGKSFFLGQVGNDNFGKYLKSVLIDNNVNTTYMKEEGQTTLALVTLDKNGERSFDFYRGSDENYNLEVNELDINDECIIHFGSAIAFLDKNNTENYYKLLKKGREKEALISFDPNYRETLITNDLIESYKENCWNFIKEADFIKLSDEEAMLLTGKDSLEEAVLLLKSLNLNCVAITLGKEGTMVIQNSNSTIVESIKIKQKDSTGAGDAFVGGVLYKLSIYSENIDYIDVVGFANVVGAITCEEYGAIPSIPTIEKVNMRIKSSKN